MLLVTPENQKYLHKKKIVFQKNHNILVDKNEYLLICSLFNVKYFHLKAKYKIIDDIFFLSGPLYNK